MFVKKPTNPFAYSIQPKAIALYYVSFAVVVGGMLLRKNAGFWSALPGGFTDSWGTHMSNLAISYLIFTGIGLMWILQGVPRKAFIWLGVVLLSANIVTESFVTILNTPDLVDAVFGIVGVLAGGITLFFLDKHKATVPPKQ